MAKFLEEPALKLIISAAKGFAAKNNYLTLDETCLLGGILVSLNDPLLAPVSTELESRRAGMATAIGEVCLPESGLVSDMPSMPLSKAFRELLEKYAEADINALPALVDASVHSLKKAAELESKQFKNRTKGMRKGPEYVSFLHLASDIAQGAGATSISPDALAVAAWRGHQLGLFKGRPALAAHIDAYAAYFSAKARHDHWQHATEITCIPYKSDGDVLPLSGDVEKHEPEGVDAVYALLRLATNTLMKADSRRRAAFHEAGHGVAFVILRPDIRVTALSVKDTRSSAGVTSIEFDATINPLMSCADGIFQHVVCLLAGRAAETAAFGPTGTNSGAISDLKHATSLLWDSIAEEGLSARLGPIHLPTLVKKSAGNSTHLTRQAEELLQSRMKVAQDTAERFVRQNFDIIEAVAIKLDDVEEMNEDDIRRVIASLERSNTVDAKFAIAA